MMTLLCIKAVQCVQNIVCIHRIINLQTAKGTEYFMPIEIASRAFAFTGGSDGEQIAAPEMENIAQLSESEADEYLRDLAPHKRQSQAADAVDRKPSTTGPVLRYIPLHDMEGFWWVSLILSIWRAVQDSNAAGADPQSKAEAQSFRRFAHDMFNNIMTRHRIMTDNYTFKNAIELLHPHLKVAGSQLEKARRILRDAYRAAEFDLTAIKTTVPDDVYSQFIRVYQAIALDLSREGDFDLVPINATFLKKQEEQNPPLAGLSLDSRKAQLGKRTRADAHFEDALDRAAGDADAALTASTSAKRMKQRDEDSVVSQSKHEDDEGLATRDTDGGKGSVVNVSGDVSEEA